MVDFSPLVSVAKRTAALFLQSFATEDTVACLELSIESESLLKTYLLSLLIDLRRLLKNI